MTGNLLPWAILLAVVVASLVLKGYVPLPSAPKRLGAPRLDSEALGRMFAAAKKIEAEEEFAAEVLRQAGETIKAAYKAPTAGPSSPPAPPSAPTA